jgi:hypothetical protein
MIKFALTVLMLTAILFSNAQNKEKAKEKKSVKDVVNAIPDMLIAQPDAGVDTNANKLVNDNMSIVIPPVWREKGTQSIIEFKVLKTDKDPLVKTFPLPDKKLAQGLSIGMGTMKKPATEKKQAMLNQLKAHITAYYKETQTPIGPEELGQKADAMMISTEPFTTNQGKTGELMFLNDIQTNQSNLVALLLIPGAAPGTTNYLQFNYLHFTYETTYPEDIMELKMFVYPDEQQAFMDFTKGIFKTLVIR